MLRRAVRPRMTEPTLQQAKVAHRSGNLKRALQLSEEGLAQPGSEFSLADRHELWVVKSHCLSALGRWVEAVCALESADHEGHIDIETDDIPAEVARLERLGATVINRLERWVVMQSPTGQRFCVVRLQRPGFPKNANRWD